MNTQIVKVADIEVANDKPFVLFGGMNVLESRDLAMQIAEHYVCLLYTSPSPRDRQKSRMPSSA